MSRSPSAGRIAEWRRNARVRRLLRRMSRLDKARQKQSRGRALGPRDWSSEPRAGREPRRNHRRSIVAAAVIVVILGGGAGWARQQLRALGVPIDAVVPVALVDGERPPAGVGEHARRLQPAPAAVSGSGGYRLLGPSLAGRARYDPCRAIHYVVRRHGESAADDRGVKKAVAAAGAASGLQFVFDGFSTEQVQRERAAYQPKRYGRRWAPVLIAFSDPRESPVLAGSVLGVGGSTAISLSGIGGPGHPFLVTGEIRLDVPQLHQRQADDDAAAKSVTFVAAEHELGHVLGLDHVKDPTQVMNSELLAQRGYGAGDLRGLSEVGAGSCSRAV